MLIQIFQILKGVRANQSKYNPSGYGANGQYCEVTKHCNSILIGQVKTFFRCFAAAIHELLIEWIFLFLLDYQSFNGMKQKNSDGIIDDPLPEQYWVQCGKTFFLDNRDGCHGVGGT